MVYPCDGTPFGLDPNHRDNFANQRCENLCVRCVKTCVKCTQDKKNAPAKAEASSSVLFFEAGLKFEPVVSFVVVFDYDTPGWVVFAT